MNILSAQEEKKIAVQATLMSIYMYTPMTKPAHNSLEHSNHTIYFQGGHHPDSPKSQWPDFAAWSDAAISPVKVFLHILHFRVKFAVSVK